MKLPRGRFYGSLLKSREVGGLTLTEYIYPPDLKVSKHGHEHAYFCLVLQGSYTESYGRKTRTCEPLTAIFHPSGEAHSDSFHQAGGRVFSVEIEPLWLERAAELSLLLNDAADFRGGTMATLIVKMYDEFHCADDFSRLAIEGLSLEVIAEASRRKVSPPEGKPPRWLGRAKELLRERLSEPLTLKLIAEQVGVHPVHLVREFRKHYRLTVGEYLRQCRVEAACLLLSTSNTPLIDIAIATGFSQQSHFSKTFKRVTGVTPAAYRQAARPR